MPSTPITGNGSARNPTLTNQPPIKTTSPSRNLKRNLRLLPVIPPSGILLLVPAVTTTSQQSHPHPQPPFPISWEKMVSFLLKNVKDVLTTISVCTVVVLATRPLTARKWPPPLSRLMPVQLQSRKKKRSNHQKRLSSPLASTQPENCIIPSCATMEAVRLQASALSDPNSLHVLLTSTSIPDSAITALIDSGSTHCFVDSKFACTHNLLLTSVPPIQLRLFDGTSNGTITQSFQFPVTFDSGETMTVNMSVT